MVCLGFEAGASRMVGADKTLVALTILSFCLSAENANFFLKPFKSQDDFSDCLASSKSNLGEKNSQKLFFLKFVRGIKLNF